jgi:hypothetical protein
MGAVRGTAPVLQAVMVKALWPSGIVTRNSATGVELDSVRGKVSEANTSVNVSDAQSPVVAQHP